MENKNNLQGLSNNELQNLNGGGLITGFLIGAYVDFEIGVAIGIKNKLKMWYDAL